MPKRLRPDLLRASVGLRLPKATPESLRGGDAAANAAIVHEVLGGKPGAHRDVVLLNAGAALFVAGKADAIGDGMRKAADAIDSGAAFQLLTELVEMSNQPQGAR